jgi:hypothetical protein
MVCPIFVLLIPVPVVVVFLVELLKVLGLAGNIDTCGFGEFWFLTQPRAYPEAFPALAPTYFYAQRAK